MNTTLLWLGAAPALRESLARVLPANSATYWLGEDDALPEPARSLGPLPQGPWWQWLQGVLPDMLAEHRRQPLLLLDARLDFPPQTVERLLRAAAVLEQPAVLSPLHPAHPDLAPLREHDGWRRADALQRDSACFLLNEPRLLPGRWLNPQAAWLHPELLQGACLDPSVLADTGACWLQPDLLLGRGDAPAGEVKDRHGQLARFVEQIHQWQIMPGPVWPGLQGEPVLLHLTHDWGGGTEQWLRDYCASEDRAVHLVLRSQGDWKRREYGQTMSLQLGPDGPLLRRWAWTPPIRSVALRHAGWQAAVAAVIDRFQVRRMLVSSFIGHSLQAVRQPIPTLWLLHDYFPVCPALNLYFGEVCRQCDRERLERCRRENPLNTLMRPIEPELWLAMRDELADCLTGGLVKQVAPSAQVLANLRRLQPALVRPDAAVIPHGLPEALAEAPGLPLPDDWRRAEKLRLVVPGQLSSAKGLDLLLQAWPQLSSMAELYLLGCGKEGRAFWGRPGVHVISRYPRAELPAYLARIRPHAALFLSTVPETFGLALVEHMHLGVVPLATNLGAYAEHVQPGENGCLLEPTATALIECVSGLFEQRERLRQLHAGVSRWQAENLRQMTARYRALLALRRKTGRPRYTVRPAHRLVEHQQEQLLLQLGRKTAALASLSLLKERQERELEDRARWARGLERDLRERTAWAQRLKEDVRQRTQWAHALLRQVNKQKSEVRGLRNSVRDLQRDKSTLRDRVERLEQQRQELERQQRELQARLARSEQERQALLASTSWRVTRPLRWLGRQLKALRHRLGFYRRQAQVLWQALFRSLRTRGLRGTWARVLLRLRGGAGSAAGLRVTPPVAQGVDSADLPRLPRAEQPLVSVVIPVYNQLHYTLACLRALAETVGEVPVEIIVVDDCSAEDQTAEVLPRVEGLVYLRNERNLGFVGSCNRGAAEARGAYLFFLNNDTQVQPGWLEPLLQQFERRPQTGLVGSQLVYPDGRLQESGGIVFSDASGWNVGRFEQPDDPRYNHARQVDYCSGAAILLPRALFEQLGGFDPVYAPAYYEDTDLAFKVREAGREVWVQPASRVVHFEGVTCGTDTASGVKKHQVINQQTFRDRWAEALKRQPPPGTDIYRAMDRGVRGRVLIIDACTPTPDQDSGSVRMQNLFLLFQQLGWKVSFLPENHAELPPYTQRFRAMGVEMLHAPWFDGPAWFERRGHEFDLVILSRHYVARQYLDLVRAWAPQAAVWFDTVDLHYLRESRQAELEDRDDLRRQAEATREQELAVARACDLTLVVSPVEQEELARVAPEVEVAVLSNIHTLPEDAGLPFEQRRDLVFVGGYQHPPNVDAAHWFVEDIFPKVREKLPDIRFHLVGSKAPDSVRALGEREGVVFHGFVEDIEPFMREMRLAVAPLRYGAGVKGKVNMSMAHGQPVVGTPMAFEGMYAEHEVHGLMAETAEDFAREVIRAYSDAALWQRLSEGGRENVRRHFSMQAARVRLQSLLPQSVEES